MRSDRKDQTRRRPEEKHAWKRKPLVHRPHRNVLRVFKGQRKNKQAGGQGGGERAEKEGWRAQQKPELTGQS